eukprot:20534-Heterococcus_DN1.PRE.2
MSCNDSVASLKQLLKDYEKRIAQHDKQIADSNLRLRNIIVTQEELDSVKHALAKKEQKVLELEHKLGRQDAELLYYAATSDVQADDAGDRLEGAAGANSR